MRNRRYRRDWCRLWTRSRFRWSRLGTVRWLASRSDVRGLRANAAERTLRHDGPGFDVVPELDTVGSWRFGWRPIIGDQCASPAGIWSRENIARRELRRSEHPEYTRKQHPPAGTADCVYARRRRDPAPARRHRSVRAQRSIRGTIAWPARRAEHRARTDQPSLRRDRGRAPDWSQRRPDPGHGLDKLRRNSCAGSLKRPRSSATRLLPCGWSSSLTREPRQRVFALQVSRSSFRNKKVKGQRDLSLALHDTRNVARGGSGQSVFSTQQGRAYAAGTQGLFWYYPPPQQPSDRREGTSPRVT